MNDLDRPIDYSDHPMSVDQKLISTMGEIDTLTDEYIRQEIDDEHYDAYVATDLVGSVFDRHVTGAAGNIEDQLGRRANEVARTLVSPDLGVTATVDQKAGHTALKELAHSHEKSADAYLEVFDEAGKLVAETVEEDLAEDYPELKLTRAHNGVLNFERKSEIGQTLRIALKVQDSRLITSVSYVKIVEENGQSRKRETPIDIESINGEIEGINLNRFKSDALVALQLGLDQLKQLKELSE